MVFATKFKNFAIYFAEETGLKALDVRRRVGAPDGVLYFTNIPEHEVSVAEDRLRRFEQIVAACPDAIKSLAMSIYWRYESPEVSGYVRIPCEDVRGVEYSAAHAPYEVRITDASEFLRCVEAHIVARQIIIDACRPIVVHENR